MAQTTPLQDHRLDWIAEGQTDREQRTLTNVAIAGTLSNNGYRYAESALQAAVTLYEGKHVYIGDPEKHKPGIRPPARHPRDLAGIITKPRFENGRIRGDIKVFTTEAGNTLLALAEANPPNVGLSQVVAAERAGNEITRIAEVTCVEVVMNPATTSTFAEGTDPNQQTELAALRQDVAALRQLVEARTGPSSHQRTPNEKPPPNDADFIAAIKAR